MIFFSSTPPPTAFSMMRLYGIVLPMIGELVLTDRASYDRA